MDWVSFSLILETKKFPEKLSHIVKLKIVTYESYSTKTYYKEAFGKRNPIDQAHNTSLDFSPELRACPRATKQGCAKCGGK